MGWSCKSSTDAVVTCTITPVINSINISLAWPYNQDLSNPIFKIAKLGLQGGKHYLFWSKHRLRLLVRIASLRRSNNYPKPMFQQKKIMASFHLKIVKFYGHIKNNILHRMLKF